MFTEILNFMKALIYQYYEDLYLLIRNIKIKFFFPEKNLSFKEIRYLNDVSVYGEK